MNLVNSFQGEWIKKRRSLASWLVIVGGFFTPTIVLLIRLKNYQALPKLNIADDFWQNLWFTSWESMAILLLPMGIILATSLCAQIENKNNAWKHLHTTPQNYTTIFLAKFAVIVVMLAQLFLLFGAGFYLSAILPSVLIKDVPYPAAPIPFALLIRTASNFFVDCLPIVALQYALSLHFKNFVAPIGIGFVIWALGIGMVSWQYSYIFPYNQCVVDFLITSGNLKRDVAIDLRALALVYFAVFFISGYVLYLMKKDKS